MGQSRRKRNSHKASKLGLNIIKDRINIKGWTQYDEKWRKAADVSEITLKRFWQNKENLDRKTFEAICQAVGENDWQSITEEFGDNKPRKLQQILYSLNYQSQSRLFEDFWNGDGTRKSGCFLVHGKYLSGQHLLVNRLFYHDFGIDAQTPCKITINLPDHRSDVCIEYLWEILSEELHCSSSITDIIDSAYNYWREETVILAFKNLDRLYKTEHQKLLDQFWLPLVEKIAPLANQSKSYFLVFLVDNRGVASNWNINCCQLENWQPCHPLDLSSIEPFGRNMLKMWINKNKNKLGELMDNNDMPNILEQVWCKSYEQGIPELAIEEICRLCGCDWNSIQKSFDL
jgi:inactive STAND